ncbi:MAG: hypothetical protein ACI4MS_06385 [Candidatus Coproplasma sp.]
MNEFELALPDKDGFEKYLEELKPAVPLEWNYDRRVYIRDNNPDKLACYSVGFSRYKSSLRYLYDYGSSVVAGIPKLCLALSDIYVGMKCVSCSDYLVPDNELGSDLVPGTCFSIFDKFIHDGNTFLKIVGQFGLSDTSAYNYKNLACIVERETGQFLPSFQGYSVSLLIEMQSYLNSIYNGVTSFYFKRLANVVPKTTTVKDFREYRKIMQLWMKRKAPFNYSDEYGMIKEYVTPLSQVLDIYDKLIQEQEQNKLKALTEQAESKDKPDPKELVANDVLIKQLREQITELKKTSVPNLGKCDGCVYSGVNLNKCRCCRRYKDLKDLFQSE